MRGCKSCALSAQTDKGYRPAERRRAGGGGQRPERRAGAAAEGPDHGLGQGLRRSRRPGWQPHHDAARCGWRRDPGGAQRALEHVNSPFGVVLVSRDLYVAATDALLRYPYREGDTTITEPGTKVTDLPGGPIDHHWTKALAASPDGSKLYVGVGSNSNITEHGLEAERGRAAIWEIDRTTGAHRTFAGGLRNPTGLEVEPQSGRLWAIVNERDEIGPNLVPDYLTSVREGAFYGGPYSYWGQHVDPRLQPPRPDLVASGVKPDYDLGSHVAPLGLAFSRTDRLGAEFRGGAFVGEHGSWNRQDLDGDKIVYVPFADGRPSGKARDVVTGFLDRENRACGRPVGVAVDPRGALLVADNLGNTVWRVTRAGP